MAAVLIILRNWNVIPLDNMRLPVVVDPLTNFVNRQSGPVTNDRKYKSEGTGPKNLFKE